jgi:hypothetical protein
MKRARTEDGAGNASGRAQLLIASANLQARLGKKYCHETELLPLLFQFGVLRRVRTIEVEVRPLGGDSFKVTLDVSRPTVGETKVEVARTQGTPVQLQELYKVAARADGGTVREDDAEPEPLEDDSEALLNGEVVAMAVKALEPLLWRTYAKESVALSEGGTMAKSLDHVPQGNDGEETSTLVTTGEVMTRGTHYWEVELVVMEEGWLALGVTRPDLDPTGDYATTECQDSRMGAIDGGLYGNGKESYAPEGQLQQGDRVGVLLDLNNGSLLFFKNGVQHGPGYPAGSVTGPVVHALQLEESGVSARLLSNLRQWPAGHAQK